MKLHRPGRALGLLMACAALAAPGTAAAVAAPTPTGSPAATHAGRDHQPVPGGPIDVVTPDTAQKLASVQVVPPAPDTPSANGVTAPAGAPTDPVDLRVLILATTGDPNPDGLHTVPPSPASWDWDLSTFTNALDYAGVPYDVYKSSTQQLCVNGTWKLNWVANPSATDTTCTGTVSSWAPDGVTANRLWDSATNHAYYEAVMQTNGTLSYGVWPVSYVQSALTSTEWAALATFEAHFTIRTVILNAAPAMSAPYDVGLIYAGEGSTTDSALVDHPITAKWTPDGNAAFPYVRNGGTLPIEHSYYYYATIDPAQTTTTKALLTDSSQHVLAAVHTYPAQGNRQTAVFTFDSAGYLIQGEVLGYAVTDWATKGLFLGERHSYLDPQVDDLFIHDSIWQSPTNANATPACTTRPDDPSLPEYRITGRDLKAFADWQDKRDNPAISKHFQTEFAFNGEGTTTDYLADYGIKKDDLTPEVKADRAKFAFVDHTWNHLNLDGRTLDVAVTTSNGVSTISAAADTFTNSWGQSVIGTGIPAGATIVFVSADGASAQLSVPATADSPSVSLYVGVTYAQAAQEITQENALAKQFKFKDYLTVNMVQPDISGLGNPNFLQAAYDNGVRYLISDTSRTGDPYAYGVNEGAWNDGSSWHILDLPRYPTNLYFNVRTPAQWLAEDQCHYPAGAYGHVDTYQQLLDRESTVLVRYLLQGRNRPLMFHQSNVAAYDGRHSLLSDLIDATYTKYQSLVDAPVQSLDMDQLGQKMIDRMAYNQALQGGLSASIVPGVSITITNKSGTAATVPVTGLDAGAAYHAETYAGRHISYVPVAAGGQVTLNLH